MASRLPAARHQGAADGRHPPGEEVRLVGERRASGEGKYRSANLPPEALLDELAALAKARWVCERARQQPKEELGPDHFEGRSRVGPHRHALMATVAFRFLQRLGPRERGEERPRTIAEPAAAAEPARGPAPAAGATQPRPRLLPVPRG